MQALRCEYCGGHIDPKTYRCPYCGTQYVKPKQQSEVIFTPLIIESQARVKRYGFNHAISLEAAHMMHMEKWDIDALIRDRAAREIAEIIKPELQIDCEQDIMGMEYRFRTDIRILDPSFRF